MIYRSLIHIIGKKLFLILQDLKLYFRNETSINWIEKPNSFDTEVDTGINLTISFKHLENSDDEGITLQVHFDKKKNIMDDLIVDFILCRSNGTAIEMDNVMYHNDENIEIKLNEMFDILDRYSIILKKIIKSDYQNLQVP